MPTSFSSASSARPSRLGLIAALFCVFVFFCSLSLAQAAPQAVSIAIGGDNLTRLLWNNPDASTSLWKLNADGTVASQTPYGPFSGWTAQALAAGANSAPRFFWNNTGGQMSLWNTTDPSPTASCLIYGPYSGWSAAALAVGGNNVARLLWNNTNGTVSLWNLTDANPSATCFLYGPYSGWSGKAIAAGADSKVRILWNNADGHVSVWNQSDANPSATCLIYGPYSGWTGRYLGVGSNNIARMVWVNTNGQVSLWNLTDANPSATCFIFAPPAGYAAAGMAVGTDNLVRLLWSDTQGHAQVWNIAADGTYAAKTYPLVASTPAYLSNLTLDKTAVTGGNGLTGTVTLSSTSSAATTVILSSNNSAVVVPASITIPAGVDRLAFSMTTNAVPASVIATLSATSNGWTQGCELSVLPSNPTVPSPGVPVIHIAPGNGCAVVSWNRLANGTVRGYNVYRTSSGTTTLLTPTPFTSNYYPDTGLTNDTATYTYQVAAVDTKGQEQALSAPVNATPFSAAVTLNWIAPPSAITDYLATNASLSSGSQVFGTLFFIDGVQAGGGGDYSSYVNGVQTHLAGTGYDSTKLSNGPHTVQLLGFADSNRTIAVVTPPFTFQVSNTISSFRVVDSGFDPTQGELCYLFAAVPAGSTWTVQVTSQDGATVFRTWQGASSLVKLAWDGKDASGKPVALTDYTLQVTVQPPGASPNTAGAQAAPNAAGTVKKTRPVSPTHGQPVALALISIGASYYLDSNKIPIDTPAQDIMLANVLTTAYTKLYGVNNFKVIRSDTIDPFVEVKTGVTQLAQLEGWLGTAQVFYMFGHGVGLQGSPNTSQTPRSTIFGDYAHTMGVHMEFFPSTVVSPSDLDILVPTYVKSHNYVFAWIDACNSAGGNPVTGEIGTVDTIWSTAFNATTFIGTNGYSIINNKYATDLSSWYTWREKFWGKMALGQTVSQAYGNCWSPAGAVNTSTYYAYYTLPSKTYDCTPGDGYGGNPRIVLYGDPFSTTLVPQ